MQAPGTDELQALVQRLAIADLDSALELSRLLAATQQAGVIAERLVKSGQTTVALAWLRRITHGVDTLQAEWLKSQASRTPLVAQPEKRADTPVAAPLGNHGRANGTARVGKRSPDRRTSRGLT
jgi:hypothetical protein